MKKRISAVVITSMFLAGSAFASGYRIPEQSIDSTAKAGANIASATNADAAYYNPANMAWTDDAWQLEGDLTYIHLTAVEYEDNRSSTMSGESEKENFLLPSIFVISPDYNSFRFGFSLVAPYGLAKRWSDPYAATFSEEFALTTIEANPTVSYSVGDKFSMAGGVRMLYSKADATMNGVVDARGITLYQELAADSIDWGWNVAAAFQPTTESNISVTYRSKIEMTLDGDIDLRTNFGPFNSVSTTGGSDSFPAPAVFALSGSYTFDALTVELTFDRTFWSEYETFEISYDDTLLNPVLASAGGPFSKDWEDTNAYRISLTYMLNETVTLMGGFAYDENPVPDETLSFELPDSDAYLYSVGVRFKVSEAMELGVSALYDYKTSREVDNGRVDGEFTNSSAFLLSAGMTYTF